MLSEKEPAIGKQQQNERRPEEQLLVAFDRHESRERPIEQWEKLVGTERTQVAAVGRRFDRTMGEPRQDRGSLPMVGSILGLER